MKKTTCTKGLWVCLSLIAIILFSSCEKEETITINFPTVKLSYSTNACYETFVRNSDVLEYSLSLNEKDSSEGIKIDRVEYFWDEQQVTDALGPEFKFSMSMFNQAFGQHTLRAEVHCSGGDYSDTTIKLSHSFTVVEEYPVINFVAEHPDTISKGETFTCLVKKDEGNTMNVSINSVTYYWDSDKLIETSMPPYQLSFLVNGVSTGEHILRVAVNVTGDWNGTITYPYTVNVK